MNGRAPIILCMLLAAPAMAEPPPASGQAACDRAVRNGTCKIAWNMTATPRGYYWIQQYDTERAGWRTIGEPSTQAWATSKAAVPAGFLYRVQACNDLEGTDDCIGTTLLWAPLHPRSVDEIPAELRDANGIRMTISKDADLAMQTAQYNVYSLVQVAQRIDLATMPAMTPPPERYPDPSTDSGLSADDLIHAGVYENYESLRALAGRTVE
jgi:hypothetical protein